MADHDDRRAFTASMGVSTAMHPDRIFDPEWVIHPGGMRAHRADSPCRWPENCPIGDGRG